VATYLDEIVTAHRAATAADPRAIEDLLDRARAQPPARHFEDALRTAAAAATGYPAVIAEVKRRSPSQGPLAPDLLPAALAQAYEAGGATCLSVLTDRDFFGAEPGDLIEARGACSLPILRKDFTVGPADVCDAVLMGADAVLLIAAVLDDAELADLHGLAHELRIDPLVEVHDEAEAERALAVGATLIGVNQRDLATFAVDRARADRMASVLPDHVVRVAESGITGPDDARRLGQAGYHAVLVGETLVRSVDPVATLRSLRGES
jgi:indole-3-glycerol phosphate synthase